MTISAFSQNVQPPRPPSWKLEDKLTAEAFRGVAAPVVAKLGLPLGSISTSSQEGESRTVQSIHDGDPRWASLKLHCLDAKSTTPMTKLERQRPGAAVYVHDRCELVVVVKEGGQQGDPVPERAKELLLAFLAAS